MAIRYTNNGKLRMCGLALTLCLALSACDEETLLNPTPETALQDKYLFDTPSRVLGQVNGMYAALKNGSFYGGRYLMLSDIRGEEFMNRLQNVFTGYDAWNHTINSGSNDALTTWSTAYDAINSANLLMAGLAENPNVVPAATAAQYVGEAKLVRALSYFALVTLYGQPYVKDNGASPGVPLRLKGEKTPANNDLARSTVAQVYEQILKDLDEAEAALPASYSTALLNTSRAHKNTAIALKTRVYLNMGKFDEVVTEAQKIVQRTVTGGVVSFKAPTGVSHQLQSSIRTIFMTNYTTTESIFSMPMTDLNNVSGQSSLGYEYNTNQEYSMNPAGILGNSTWRSVDERKTMFRTSGSTTYLMKYSKFNPFLDYVPVIRYAEVLLNYAEALARKSSPEMELATELLNAVRKRSDPGYEFPAASIATPAAFTSTVMVERRIEFVGEGLRSNDLLRNLLTIPAKGTAPAIAPSRPEYIFPIPNAEISANKAL